LTYRDIQVRCPSHTVQVKGQEITLTPKEFDLLKYLILNQGLTLSREQLLRAVWGANSFQGERTVDTHIKCLRAKLGDAGQAIQTVIRVGYRLEEI